MANAIETLKTTLANHYGKVLLGLAGFGVYATLSAFASFARTAVNG